ncbi:hypothetical protein KAR10_06265 [bacterium]|nr:hypothetical protein [bacterium]
MDLRELNNLLTNFDPMQLECLGNIAVKMATVKADSWTGKVLFEIDINQGGIRDLSCNRNERIRLTKKRKVRSSGI